MEFTIDVKFEDGIALLTKAMGIKAEVFSNKKGMVIEHDLANSQLTFKGFTKAQFNQMAEYLAI